MKTFRVAAQLLLLLAAAGSIGSGQPADELAADEPAAVMPAAPLPLGKTGAVPTQAPRWPWWMAALLPASVLWTGLALRRAQVSDANYERRRARRALRRWVRRLRRERGAPAAAALERWQRLTAAMMGVTRAAPTATDIVRALDDIEGAPDKQVWFTLWLEARRAIYGAAHPLPADWVARAFGAVEATRVLRASSVWPQGRKHWLPLACWIACLDFVLPIPDAVAASEAGAGIERGAEAYSAGDYAGARTAWQAWLAEHPTDWAAHTNLGLAYAQETIWGGAAAHWTAAFLQAPRDPVVAANLRLGLAHLDGVDPALRRVVEGPWYDRAIGAFSPAEWEAVGRWAAVLSALGLCGLVVSFYGGSVGARRTAQIVVAGGVVLGGLSFAAGERYGILGDPAVACIVRATDLRPVPSDLVEQQQMAPLLPGRLVIVDGTYFGWLRIRVGNETVGWVRRGMVLPLYVAPPARTASGIDPDAPRPPAPEPSADARSGD